MLLQSMSLTARSSLRAHPWTGCGCCGRRARRERELTIARAVTVVRSQTDARSRCVLECAQRVAAVLICSLSLAARAAGPFVTFRPVAQPHCRCPVRPSSRRGDWMGSLDTQHIEAHTRNQRDTSPSHSAGPRKAPAAPRLKEMPTCNPGACAV